MSALTVFGLFAVTAMLVFYALEERNPLFTLCFAAACLLGSIYGFLQGAWPFGLVEAVWAAVAARRWWLKKESAGLDDGTVGGSAEPRDAGTAGVGSHRDA
jgi:hypothetical protein